LQEQTEVVRVPLVRRSGQQQQMVRDVAQQLAKFVTQAFVGLIDCRHAMRFIHDDEIPVDLPKSRQDFLPLGEVKRGDDTVALQPLVYTELVTDVLALKDEEFRVKLLLELALPLESQICGTDD